MSGTKQRRRRALRAAAPVAGLLAAGLLVWQGSYAAFSATTDNTNDAWATGRLRLQNNGGGAGFADSTNAWFAESGLRPGSTGVKCLTVESTGDLAGSLRLWRGNVTGSAPLAAALNVTVEARTVPVGTNVQSNCANWTAAGVGAVTTLHNGVALSALPTTYAAAATGVSVTGSATERVAYRLSWTLPSSVTDNTLQNTTATTSFTWEVQTP